ncbi:hypothetical protein LCGC14_2242740 [marine sediment metagenome]|uniref:Uncharacterized protein n=1 Tax=marine sediment metagenome TaxID=412755 RepID=A0A0F9FZW6_9ZZZZ
MGDVEMWDIREYKMHCECYVDINDDEEIVKCELCEAAPDMYEALKLAVDALTIKLNKPTYQETLEFNVKVKPVILSALAKAEGK